MCEQKKCIGCQSEAKLNSDKLFTTGEVGMRD